MKIIIAVLIVLTGVGGGLALGVVLQPGGDEKSREATYAEANEGTGSGADDDQGGSEPAEAAAKYGAGEGGSEYGGEEGSGGDGEIGSDRNFVKIGRQIIIPVVIEGETQALMLFDLALDVPSAMTERTYAAEPRLRDAFLRELFELSYTGAFSSTYTDERIVEEMRARLREAARRLLGDAVAEVLILDIMRQEL